jgi:hypothetical protein
MRSIKAYRKSCGLSVPPDLENYLGGLCWYNIKGRLERKLRLGPDTKANILPRVNVRKPEGHHVVVAWDSRKTDSGSGTS